MKFWERVKKDLRVAMKEGADLIKEGTAVLATETSRVSKKGAAAMSVEARKMMEGGVATAKKGAATVTAETQRIARIANLRYRLFRENQAAHEKFTEIGGWVYDRSEKTNAEQIRLDGHMGKLILEAKKIEGRVRKLEAEIQRLSGSRSK
jgi:hypothetical protein